MKLTTKGRYAVMAMADLALFKDNGPTSLTDISLRQNISFAYLEQIFIKLKNNSQIKKVILCSGKVYFDLLDAREKLKRDDVVMYRIEQLYPFPAKALVKELKPYAKNAEFFWCQEEPKNMGAWFSVRDYIQWTLDTLKANNNKISYIGRSPDATPATGYAKRHNSQQQEIINKVFD